MDKIFDGRLLFICSKCSVCAVVPKDAGVDGPDSAYLEFLELYDNGLVTENDDLNVIMRQERILRPSSEIKTLLEKTNEGTTNRLLNEVMSSKKDYVVEFKIQIINMEVRLLTFLLMTRSSLHFREKGSSLFIIFRRNQLKKFCLE